MHQWLLTQQSLMQTRVISSISTAYRYTAFADTVFVNQHMRNAGANHLDPENFSNTGWVILKKAVGE